VTLTLDALIVDAVDPEGLGAFWSTALGPQVQRRLLRFRPQRQAKSAKNRVHLDIYVRDVESICALGARVLAEYAPTRATLADPEGNEFCAFIDPMLQTDAPAKAFAVCTDSDRPAELARWWADLVGAEVGPGPDGAPRYLSGAALWDGLIWKFVSVDDARLTPNRWQWSVTGDRREIQRAGAHHIGGDQFVDPQGNDFSARGRVTPAG
jgi:hypothetical protein